MLEYLSFINVAFCVAIFAVSSIFVVDLVMAAYRNLNWYIDDDEQYGNVNLKIVDWLHEKTGGIYGFYSLFSIIFGIFAMILSGEHDDVALKVYNDGTFAMFVYAVVVSAYSFAIPFLLMLRSIANNLRDKKRLEKKLIEAGIDPNKTDYHGPM